MSFKGADLDKRKIPGLFALHSPACHSIGNATPHRPLNQTYNYTYDDLDRLASRTLGRGQKQVYQYAPWGGLTQVDIYASGSPATPARTQGYTYDNNGNLATATDTAIQSGALYTHSYDALDRISQTLVHYIPGGNRQLQYAYDAFGNRSNLTFTDGASVTSHSYGVDNLNRLTTVTLAGQSYPLWQDSCRLFLTR